MKINRPTPYQTTLGDLGNALTLIAGGVLRDPQRVQYRGYVIYYDPKPIPPMKEGFIDWAFHHDDYDGPEDGRCGWGVSVADCKAQIDEQIEDLEAEEEGWEPDEQIWDPNGGSYTTERPRTPESSPTGGLRADANHLLGVDSDFWGTGLEGNTPTEDDEPSIDPDLIPDRMRAIEAGDFDEFGPEDE